MAKATVLIGCKLPHGLVLRLKDTKVTIDGMNKSKIVGATHITTEVDAEFWTAWKAAHKDFQPLKSLSIFEATGVRDAEDKAKELEKKKTGFEPLKKDAGGVKPADAKA